MSTLKLIGLLLISFIATGSIIYNIRNRRPPRPAVAVAQPGTVPISVNAPPPAPAPVVAPKPEGAPAPGDAEKTGQRADIPSVGWGRNPFLTVDEIDKLNRPELPVAVETPAPKRAAEPPELPPYALTGIIAGPEEKLVIIDGRTLRAGSRIGSETVKEVKDRSVVLEHQGQFRELRLKSIEETAAAAAPKKETKP